MGDKQKNPNQLKTQYRSRFYRDRVDDLPEVQPGTSVLSAIKVYFKKSGGDESPASSTSSFLADSVTNINTPESFLKKHGSSTNPRVSKLKGLQFTGNITETKMKATKSPTVNEKVKTPPNNFNVNEISESEMEDSESDMPLNLVVEKEKENEIVRLVRNPRDWMYSSESSVVQEPPGPATKFSPQKRLRFSDAFGSDKASFASIFANKYKSGPADDGQTIPMQDSVRYVDNDPSPKATTESVAKEDEEEFVIEDEQSINMSFSLVNKRSSAGSPQETRSTTSKSVRGNQKLQGSAVEVFSGQSPFSLSRGNRSRKESSQNVYRIGTSDDISRDILSAETPKTTKITPLSATNESQKLSIKLKAISDQPLSYSKPIQLTRQTIRELELSEEEDFESIWNANRKKIKIPRTTKAKAEISKSSSVSHQKAEIESAEKVSEQSTMQSQMVKKTLRGDKTNKVKDTLCEDPNSLAPPFVEIVTIEPPTKRKNITDHSDPVLAEDEEFVIHDITDLDSNSKSWKKKPHKIPNDVKKNKKSEKNVPSEVLNVTYTSAKKSDSIVRGSRESHNDPSDSSSPYREKKEKTSRRNEADKLVLQKNLQTDLENQNDRTSSRSKRLSSPPSDWWVVQQAGKKFGMEEALPEHLRKSKRKASVRATKKTSEWQNDDEESFELKERPLEKDAKSLKKSDEKFSKTIDARKISKKRKPVEREEMAGPSKVKKPKNNKACKKPQAATKKTLKATRLWKQLGREIRESSTTSSPEHDLNVHDLPYEIDSLSVEAIPTSPPMNDPQCPTLKRRKPILHHRDIQPQYLENYKPIEEEEPQPNHRLPRQSHTSPDYESAKLTFQSGPVIKTKPMRYNNLMDGIVRNLTSDDLDPALPNMEKNTLVVTVHSSIPPDITHFL
ncbi:uncharacterized protein ACMZJ9_000076 [Mantella aurantiaca]